MFIRTFMQVKVLGFHIKELERKQQMSFSI